MVAARISGTYPLDRVNATSGMRPAASTSGRSSDSQILPILRWQRVWNTQPDGGSAALGMDMDVVDAAGNPVRGEVGGLSVSVAAGIALFESVRRRTLPKP